MKLHEQYYGKDAEPTEQDKWMSVNGLQNLVDHIVETCDDYGISKETAVRNLTESFDAWAVAGSDVPQVVVDHYSMNGMSQEDLEVWWNSFSEEERDLMLSASQAE